MERWRQQTSVIGESQLPRDGWFSFPEPNSEVTKTNVSLICAILQWLPSLGCRSLTPPPSPGLSG